MVGQATRITPQFVRDIKPPRPDRGDKRQLVYIETLERGLALVFVVSYGGSKTFRVLTYVNGKPKTHWLGKYPTMTVSQARAAAMDYWHDPKKFVAKAAKNSFKQVAENWIKRHVDENQLRSKPEIERMLNKYVYPKFGSKRFLEIDREHINDLLDGIVDNHGRSQADAVLAVIRGICNWYAARSSHYVNPIVRDMKRDKRKSKIKARKRFLNDNEIRMVWEAADACGSFGDLVKLALLTGQRRGRFGEKSTAMRWSEISTDGLWVFNREERRKSTADQIKLPAMALALIAEQPKIDGNPFVFPGGPKGPFNHFSQGMDELRKLLPDMPRWTLHDLRRTARKLMTRAGVRPDVGELALGHSIKGIQEIYDDIAEYQPMIDHAFECVANEIDKIINGTGAGTSWPSVIEHIVNAAINSNVIPLKPVKGVPKLRG